MGYQKGPLMETNPWEKEPELFPESKFQSDGFGGSEWHAWNSMSPELEFCEWVKDTTAALVAEQAHVSVLETGMGQGYVTRRVLSALRPFDLFEVYENDQNFIDLMASAFRDHTWPWLNYPFIFSGLPSAVSMARADLVILDSDLNHRYTEMDVWAKWGKPGSQMIVHDTYHRKQPDSELASKVKRIGGVELWFDNPRGAALLRHP